VFENRMLRRKLEPRGRNRNEPAETYITRSFTAL
jgi:hypothetical protein